MDIVNGLEDEYKVMVCPNGGDQRDVIFRVSHMGDMTKEYTDVLIDALHDYYNIDRV
jgi:aspartate aminotransferase-like enzyme